MSALCTRHVAVLVFYVVDVSVFREGEICHCDRGPYIATAILEYRKCEGVEALLGSVLHTHKHIDVGSAILVRTLH